MKRKLMDLIWRYAIAALLYPIAQTWSVGWLVGWRLATLALHGVPASSPLWLA